MNWQTVNESPSSQPWRELERSLTAAAETYANVHRGSGHFSQVTTHLYEEARAIVREHFGRDRAWEVIFCTPQHAGCLEAQLPAGSYDRLSSEDLGLPLGVRALVVRRRALPKGTPPQPGGGTVGLVSPRWTLWAGAPDRFEPGTPAVLNVIALARALQLTRQHSLRRFPIIPQVDDDTALAAGEFPELRGAALLQALRATTLGADLPVSTADGARPYTNFDNAASTPTLRPVLAAALRALRLTPADRKDLADSVRETLARITGAPQTEYEIIFTSNTTEAINLAAGNLRRASAGAGKPLVLGTLLEHNSNELPWRYAVGAQMLHLPVDSDGYIDLDEMERLLVAHAGRVRLATISAASNVLGTFNDVAAAARLAHRYGAEILVDGAQLLAHRPIDLFAAGVDYFSCSAHKAYAPFGSGALIARRSLLRYTPEERAVLHASGEENTVGLAAFGCALRLLERTGLDCIEEEERRLTARLLSGLERIPGLRVYGLPDPRDPRFSDRGPVVTLQLDTVPHNLAAQELAQRGGIGVRAGCFCAHLLIKSLLRIHPLRARAADLGLLVVPGFTNTILPGLVRISIGLENDEADVDHLLDTLARIAAQPRGRLTRWLGSVGNGTPFLPRDAAQAKMDQFALAVSGKVFGSSAQNTREESYDE